MNVIYFLFISEDDSDSTGDKSKEGAKAADNPPESPVDVRENIRSKFLVDMPEDFYLFWDFAKTINSKNPTGKHMITGPSLCQQTFDVL